MNGRKIFSEDAQKPTTFIPRDVQMNDQEYI